MHDILTEIDRWQADGQRVALATVIETWGSSPRAPGSRMAVTAEGAFAGSVSGGCVESAVVEAAQATLDSGCPQLLHFGIPDEAAWNVGLACGGSMEVFVNPLERGIFDELRAGLTESESLALVTVVHGPAGILGRQLLLHEDGRKRSTLGIEPERAALMIAREALAESSPGRHRLESDVELFVEVILPPLTLIVVGGVHVALPLVSMARTLGYKTILIDPRKAWGNSLRFGQVDRLVAAWPERAFEQIEVTARTAIIALTHEPRLDDPALKLALLSPAFYVGALGSRTTHSRRRARLAEAGLTTEQISRLHAPVGLDIGAENPEEIALAILAEVVASMRNRSVKPNLIPATLASQP